MKKTRKALPAPHFKWRIAPSFNMQYFYDHQTDAVSFIIGDFADYATIEEVSPGIVMYLDRLKRAIAVEVRGATGLVDTKGLMPLYSRPITADEIGRRMRATPAAERAWTAVVTRAKG